MSGFDIAVVLIVVFFGIIGWIRGFSWQLMGVITIVLGFTVAYPLSGWLQPTMSDWLGYGLTKQEMSALSAGDQRDVTFLARGASWAMAFGLIWLFSHVCYYFFREAIEKWHMEEMNRTLGGFFGVVKGVLVICAMVLVLVILGVERTRQSDRTVQVRVPSLIYGSYFAPHIVSTMRALRFALPSSFGSGLSHYLDALDHLDPETHAANVDETEGDTPTPPPAKPGKADGDSSGDGADSGADAGADSSGDTESDE